MLNCDVFYIQISTHCKRWQIPSECSLLSKKMGGKFRCYSNSSLRELDRQLNSAQQNSINQECENSSDELVLKPVLMALPTVLAFGRTFEVEAVNQCCEGINRGYLFEFLKRELLCYRLSEIVPHIWEPQSPLQNITQFVSTTQTTLTVTDRRLPQRQPVPEYRLR